MKLTAKQKRGVELAVCQCLASRMDYGEPFKDIYEMYADQDVWLGEDDDAEQSFDAEMAARDEYEIACIGRLEKLLSKGVPLLKGAK